MHRALSNMLTAVEIAPAVEQIASPVTDISFAPQWKNLELYVNYVPCKLFIGLERTNGLENAKWDSFSRSSYSHYYLP